MKKQPDTLTLIANLLAAIGSLMIWTVVIAILCFVGYVALATTT